MSITITCPNCKVLFRLPEEMAGTKVKCAKCEHIFTVAVGATKPRTKVDPEETSVAPRVALPPPVATAAAAPPDDDEHEPPRSDRSRRRDEDDRDDDDRERGRGGRYRDREPERRRSKSAGGSSTMMWVLLFGGLGLGLLLCLICGGGITIWALAVREGAAPAAKIPAGAINARLDAGGGFRDENRLTINDPRGRHNWPHKFYAVQLEAGRTYQLDLISNEFDAYLVLLDDNNIMLREDDDGGGNLNSRIIFRPNRTAVYRIQATSLGGGGQGRFTLIVQRR